MKALVKIPVARVYNEPDAGLELTDELLSGMIVEVVGEAGEFIHVRAPYHYEGFASAEDFIMQAKAVAEWENAAKLTVTGFSADVLAEPRVQAQTICSLTKGCVVRPLLETENGWRAVETTMGKGYMRERFLRPSRPGYNYGDEAGFRRQLVAEAFEYLGVQYRWGGKTPRGIDCSGLCSMCYLLNGVYIYRDACLKPDFPMREIPFDSAKPGDLLFFPGHVAMYLGRGMYIHSTIYSDGVTVNSFNPGDPHFRKDLADSLTACGSIFGGR